MTQQDKELLIKDLCARLPYGVKVQTPDIDRGNCHKFESGIFTLHEINIYGLVEIFEEEIGVISIEDIKPILFPMSAINQEIEVNGEKVKIYGIINNNFNHRFFIDSDGDISIEGDDASYVYLKEYSFILDTFHRYHIDYRNLIGKGLAISVFDLPENPYK